MMPQASSPEHPETRISGLSALLEATATAEESHFWFRGFRRFVAPALDAASAGRRDLRMADCGAGTGRNLALLAQYGRPVGIELTAEGTRIAHARGERRMCRGDVAALPIPSGAIDLATSFDVLYCLPAEAERAALEEMHRILKPGGKLIVTVAAMPGLRGAHSDVALEVRRYTKQSLTAALDRAGFDPIRVTYTNASTLPIVAAVRALQRRGRLRSDEPGGRDMQTPPAPINALLSAALALEARLLRAIDMPLGSSLLAFARKPQ